MTNYKGISDSTLDQLLPAVIEITEHASKSILEVYDSDFAVERKNDDSPLTTADMSSHKIIIDGLTNLTPDIPILSEESSSIPFEERRQWKIYWLVDPLDGTKEFIKRNGEFTVNIALIKDHQPVLGVVYVPVSNTAYYASTGNGSFKMTSGKQAEAIHIRKTIVGHITIAGSRSHASEMQKKLFNVLGPDVVTINKGSSLKFCLIAEGEVDIYARFGPTSEWDTAAAHCVVKEAGGDVVDLNFNSLTYNTKDSILNPHFLVIGDTEFNWRTYLNKVLG